MQERDINFYLDAFLKLRRATMQGVKAPHKPLLLLAIMRLIEDVVITHNKIELSDSLIDCFKLLWKEYVDDGNEGGVVMLCEDLQLDISRKYPFKCSIENPFFYMQYEPFWELIKSDSYVKRTNYSQKGLRSCFLYARIDQQLFELMQDVNSRDILRIVLLEVLDQ